MLFVSVWAVWSYCGTDLEGTRVSQLSLVRAVSYYNSNRGAAVLSGVKSVAAGTVCDKATGWASADLSASWGGSAAGCLVGGKTTVGACAVVKGVAVGVA